MDSKSQLLILLQVENVAVVATEAPLLTSLRDPVKGVGAVSGAIIFLWLFSALFKRIFRPKNKGEPVITVS